jgi:hypothetical protein
VGVIWWCFGNCSPFALAVGMRDSPTENLRFQLVVAQYINDSSILNDECETPAWPMSLVRIHNDGHESLGSNHLFALVSAERP